MILLTSISEVARAIGQRAAGHLGRTIAWSELGSSMGFVVRVPHLARLVYCLACVGFAWGQKATVKQLHVPFRCATECTCQPTFFYLRTCPLPTILVRTPYGKGAAITSNYQASWTTATR